MKKKLLVLFIILGIICAGIFYKKYHDKKIYDQLSVEFIDNVLIEYGSELEVKDLIVSNSGEITFISELDTLNVSKQKLQVKVKEENVERIFEKEFEVIDTQYPIIELYKDVISVNYGKTYNFKDNIKFCYDVVDGELEFETNQEVDFNKSGSYKVQVKTVDLNNNETLVEYTIKVLDKATTVTPTFIKGILIVNKTYALPSTYGSGIDSVAYQALLELQKAASAAGHDLPLLSGYRSYATQKSTYEYWCNLYGEAYAQNVSARPGHSEHQTGLAFDVASLKSSFGDTEAGKWLESNCAEYGFILRYPKNKTHITGYYYEPWHIRYVGTEHSIPIMSQNLTLEEYLGVKS